MIGWIVVGWSDGQRFGVAASSQELLRIAETSALESMVAVYDRKHPSSLNAKKGDGLRLDPPAVRETAAAAAPAPPPQQQTAAAELITLTRAVEVPIAYGKTRLSAGTRLRVVSRTGMSINAVYLGETVAVPRDAVSTSN